MTLDEDELQEVLEGVWLPMLELAVHPADDEGHDSDTMLGCQIGLQGAYNGCVYLMCSRAVLQHAASRMFGEGVSESCEADARDALAELTNMAAGIIKSVLPEPTNLSLPQPAPESAWPDPAHADSFGRFDCHGEPVQLVLCGEAA